MPLLEMLAHDADSFETRLRIDIIREMAADETGGAGHSDLPGHFFSSCGSGRGTNSTKSISARV